MSTSIYGMGAKPVRRLWTVVGLLASVAALAAVIWWVGPWSAQWRYARTDLVTLRRLADHRPTDRLAWRELGLRLARNGDGAMAEPALLRAAELAPSDAEVATALGEIYLSRGQRDEAFQFLRTAVEHQPSFPPARMALGFLYRRRGAYHRAAEQFEVVARSRSDYPDAWYQLARCYLEMQQVAKATEAIGRALKAAPREPAYLAMQAAVMAAVGKMTDAKASLTLAAQEAPSDPKIHADLAALLIAHGEGPEDVLRAEQAIHRLRTLRPDHPALPYLSGRRALQRQDWTGAVSFLEEARKITPDQDEVYYALSQVYRRTGRDADAERALSEYRRRQELRRQMNEVQIRLAVTREPAPLYEQLAELQLRLGDRRSARGSLETALQHDPDSPRIRKRLAALSPAPAPGGPVQ